MFVLRQGEALLFGVAREKQLKNCFLLAYRWHHALHNAVCCQVEEMQASAEEALRVVLSTSSRKNDMYIGIHNSVDTCLTKGRKFALSRGR